MDTVIDYTILAESHETAQQMMLSAQDEMDRISDLLWEENPKSEIYRFNLAKDSIHTTEEVYQLLERAKQYYKDTQTIFDISIKAVLAKYQFGSEKPTPPTPEQILKAFNAVGFNNVTLAHQSGDYIVSKDVSGVRLAVGGIAKGYAVDRAMEILRGKNLSAALINAGGDLYCLGTKNGNPWRVGIQEPRNTNGLAEVLQMRESAVATSGDYQRYYMENGVRYHHILNPSTGLPARQSRSATIVSSNTEQADAFATALFIMGPVDGIGWVNSLPEIEGMVIDSTGTTYYSDGFADLLEK